MTGVCLHKEGPDSVVALVCAWQVYAQECNKKNEKVCSDQCLVRVLTPKLRCEHVVLVIHLRLDNVVIHSQSPSPAKRALSNGVSVPRYTQANNDLKICIKVLVWAQRK